MKHCSEYVQKVCERLSTSIPNPHVELNFSSDYECLVAVLLSAQTTDIRVNIVTKELFKIADTPTLMCKLGVEKLAQIIKSIGLFQNKAKNIIELSKILANKTYANNNMIPNSLAELTQLPGIGRKSANVVLNTIFNQPAIAIDTHVIRVTQKLELANTANPEKIEKILEEIIPEKYKKNIGNLFVLHGRYVCKAKKPMCNECVLNDICDAKNV